MQQVLLFVLFLGLACFASCQLSPVNVIRSGRSETVFNEQLQTTCTSVSGSAKIPTGGSALAMTHSTCVLVEKGLSTSIQVSSYNPTGDDSYAVYSYYWPNTLFQGDACEISGEGCSYGGLCNYNPSKSQHFDVFNISACGPNSAAFVEFDCVSTPGVFNDHCEIEYTIYDCGSIMLNTTVIVPPVCED